jgi:hypothetical protein
MSLLGAIRKLWYSVAPRTQSDVEEEFRSTLDAYQEGLIRQGLSEEEARRKARIDLGRPTALERPLPDGCERRVLYRVLHRTIRLRLFYSSIAPDHDVDSHALLRRILAHLGPLNFRLANEKCSDFRLGQIFRNDSLTWRSGLRDRKQRLIRRIEILQRIDSNIDRIVLGRIRDHLLVELPIIRHHSVTASRGPQIDQ